MIGWRQHDDAVTLCAFDLLQLDGEDLRREPIEVRKATLKGLLRRARPGVAFNRHFEVNGTVVYEQACALGCEGIVSKRLGSPYRQAAAIVGSRSRIRRQKRSRERRKSIGRESRRARCASDLLALPSQGYSENARLG